MEFGHWFAFILLVGSTVFCAAIGWWAGCGVWPWQRLYKDDRHVSIVDWWKNYLWRRG